VKMAVGKSRKIFHFQIDTGSAPSWLHCKWPTIQEHPPDVNQNFLLQKTINPYNLSDLRSQTTLNQTELCPLLNFRVGNRDPMECTCRRNNNKSIAAGLNARDSKAFPSIELTSFGRAMRATTGNAYMISRTMITPIIGVCLWTMFSRSRLRRVSSSKQPYLSCKVQLHLKNHDLLSIHFNINFEHGFHY